jgi:hypothetical protein
MIPRLIIVKKIALNAGGKLYLKHEFCGFEFYAKQGGMSAIVAQMTAKPIM